MVYGDEKFPVYKMGNFTKKPVKSAVGKICDSGEQRESGK